MKSIRILAAVAILMLASGTIVGQQYPSRDRSADRPPEVPEAERQAAMKVQAAADATAKLEAAGEFIKKYSKSKVRPQIATHVAAAISEVQDIGQRITLAEGFLAVFTETGEPDLVNPLLTDAYFKAGRLDDALRAASVWVEKKPDDLSAITMMALITTEQVKRNKMEFVQRAKESGLKAVRMIEADKRGALDETQWNDYKSRWLPHLYQSMGLVNLVANNGEEARANLEKAAQLNSSDPFTYYLLGQVLNESYQQMRENYKSMSPGPAQEGLLKEIHSQMDKIIDLYAQSVALAEGNPQYTQLREQTMRDLESYYKYRHNGTEGLRQLIDKYKKSTAP